MCHKELRVHHVLPWQKPLCCTELHVGHVLLWQKPIYPMHDLEVIILAAEPCLKASLLDCLSMHLTRQGLFLTGNHAAH